MYVGISWAARHSALTWINHQGLLLSFSEKKFAVYCCLFWVKSRQSAFFFFFVAQELSSWTCVVKDHFQGMSCCWTLESHVLFLEQFPAVSIKSRALWSLLQRKLNKWEWKHLCEIRVCLWVWNCRMPGNQVWKMLKHDNQQDVIPHSRKKLTYNKICSSLDSWLFFGPFVAECVVECLAVQVKC